MLSDVQSTLYITAPYAGPYIQLVNSTTTTTSSDDSHLCNSDPNLNLSGGRPVRGALPHKRDDATSAPDEVEFNLHTYLLSGRVFSAWEATARRRSTCGAVHAASVVAKLYCPNDFQDPRHQEAGWETWIYENRLSLLADLVPRFYGTRLGYKVDAEVDLVTTILEHVGGPMSDIEITSLGQQDK